MSADFNGGPLVPKELRSRALRLANQKLTGEKRTQAVEFVRGRYRRVSEIEAFIGRVEKLADVVREAHPNAVITDAQAAQLRADRAGMTLQKLADKYGLSSAQVRRICLGESRTSAQAGPAPRVVA